MNKFTIFTFQFTKMKIKRKVFNTKAEIAPYLAEELISLTSDNRLIYIALSGGSTPQVIFDILANDFKNKIKWENLRFFWVDERCVPPNDNESNYRMTKNHLFSKLSIDEEHIFRIKGELNPMDALTEYIEEINSHVPKKNGLPYFDLTILGMGDDGHTASIFPHEIELWNSNNICALGHHPLTSQTRITLTGKVINNSNKIIFLVTGSNKADKVKAIFKKNSEVKKYPAALADTSKSIWLMDKEAAKLIV